jgi:hypothetical protein
MRKQTMSVEWTAALSYRKKALSTNLGHLSLTT